MRQVRLGKIGLLSTTLLLLLQSPLESKEAMLMKTPKGYRLTILPVMGAEKVERKPVAEGKVRVQTLRERVYGRKEAAGKQP
ncbi:hypothetical protein MAMC_00657 [Methylacidimicrobium cyclopophantes]|uniref:Uncharacterized protein n=1 Tax=Methylacidimicrobium cyclopophantes TaxID=1041766 RepID=A0A5E6M8H7_9BACT|nr:hypothetical protein [Methylacidimicrobium cyclopophantes]VVM05547.1 hypothetical protein MAMC_00657 [Methylacidimicrobium cyclopophantes]